MAVFLVRAPVAMASLRRAAQNIMPEDDDEEDEEEPTGPAL